MTPLQQEQLAFLTETIQHYNSNNRGQDNRGVCQYSPSEASKGCAIGRHIEDKTLCVTLDNGVGEHSAAKSVNSEIVFKLLPESLQQLGQDFLIHMQKLHDNPLNWIETGLTNYGLETVKEIKSIFGLSI